MTAAQWLKAREAAIAAANAKGENAFDVRGQVKSTYVRSVVNSDALLKQQLEDHVKQLERATMRRMFEHSANDTVAACAETVTDGAASAVAECQAASEKQQ